MAWCGVSLYRQQQVVADEAAGTRGLGERAHIEIVRIAAYDE